MQRTLVDRIPQPTGAHITKSARSHTLWLPVWFAASVLPLCLITAGFSWPTPAEANGTEHLRIRIAEHGIYQLGYDDLMAAGVPVGSIDPRTLRLLSHTWQPEPVFADVTPASWETDSALPESAIWVQGEDDGSFDPGDRVVFYALGPDTYLDLTGSSADSLVYGQYPYEDHNTLWLEWGGAVGLRMNSTAASVSDPQLVPATRGWQRRHFEENVHFATVDDLWYWHSIHSGSPFSTNIAVDLAGESTVPGNLHIIIGAAGFANATHQLQVTWNGLSVGEILWNQPLETFPPNGTFDFPVQLLASNQLEISTVGAPQQTLLLAVDVSWDGLLAQQAGDLVWRHRGQDSEQVHELTGFGADAPILLEVTDALHPRRLVDPTAEGTGSATLWRAQDTVVPGTVAHYRATSAPNPLAQDDLTLHATSALRDAVDAPRMLIITHTALLSEAERLAAHRRLHYPGVVDPDIRVVTTQDIYDNFSGGRVDPFAIRNAIKFLWNLDPAQLQDVLLFGDATQDPRQWQQPFPIQVPTVHPWYADPAFRRAYAVDDWLVEMGEPQEISNPFRTSPVPDLALGRLPVSTLAQAQAVVDKIIAFDLDTDYGAWRSRLLLTADDECSHGNCIENFIIGNSEDFAARIPAPYDIEKLYLTEFPLHMGQKPAARQAFIDLWNSGQGLINFYGHSGANQLADEVLFLSSDIASLSNGTRLPIYVNLGRNGSFDSPYSPIGEELLWHPGGGAIAVVSGTTDTYFGPNAGFTDELFQSLFAAGPFSAIPLGQAMLTAKKAIPGARDAEMFVLLGDPTTRLRTPAAEVTFSGLDTLVVGEQVELEGFVHLPGDAVALQDFQGEAEVLLLSSVDDSGYDSPTPPNVHIDYDLPGVPVLSQRVAVVNGRIRFPFTVPPTGGFAPDVDLNPGSIATDRAILPAELPARPGQTIQFGPRARLRVYAWSNSLDAQGAHDNVLYARTLPTASASAADQTDPAQEAAAPTQAVALPTRMRLHQNTPNPFNPATTIRFDLPRPTQVSLRVYDVTGRLVRILVDAPMTAGFDHQVDWNGLDDAGNRVPSGIYFTRLIAADETETRKMLLMK